MLCILEPISSIFRSILMQIYAHSMSLIIFPLANINLAICMNKSSHPIGLIINPIALVKGKIFPNLFSPSISHSIIELANISSSVLKFNWSLLYVIILLLIIVFKRTQTVSSFSRDVIIKLRWIQSICRMLAIYIQGPQGIIIMFIWVNNNISLLRCITVFACCSHIPNDNIQIIFIFVIRYSQHITIIHSYNLFILSRIYDKKRYFKINLCLKIIIGLFLIFIYTIIMQSSDLYSERFNQKQLDGVYKFFNEILSNPQPATSEEQLLEQKLDNERQRVIKMDCLRTRSPVFDQALKDDLQILLTHYCRRHNMKYKQGLNQIAAPFIFFRKLGIPISKCQAIFHNFFSNFCLNFYDDDNFSSIQIFVKMFSVVLKYHDPALARYLEWHNVEPQLFCINWLMTFFSSKLSLSLIYMLWGYIAAEKDKFLLFFLVLAIVQINRQKIIQSKNINILTVVTNLIFKQEQTLQSVVERALLLRKNTPSSIILFFRDRMIFQKRENFNDIALLLQHMENLNLFLVLPGEMTLDQHLANGNCDKECYFCDLRKPLTQPQTIYNKRLRTLIQISSDIRTMNLSKQFVIMDVRTDQSRPLLTKTTVFKVDHKQKIQTIQQKFLSQYIEQKGRKHFIFVLTNFSYQDLDVCDDQELQRCKKIISSLNSLSFPLLSVLQGGFQALNNQEQVKQTQNNKKKPKSMIHQNLLLCNYEFPYSFPLKISDRCKLGTALCGDQAIIFIGIVEALVVFDYFIFVIPIQKQVLGFINYFQHNNSIIQYLSQKPNIPAQMMVHRVVSIGSLKKASMKVHNQNILVLLYDSCPHQQKRIFESISSYIDMDIGNFNKLMQVCKTCQKTKSKIVLELNQIANVKQCVNVLTKKYMSIRKKVKMQQ